MTKAAALALSLTATAHAADGGAPSIKIGTLEGSPAPPATGLAGQSPAATHAPADPRPETLFVGAFPLESRLSRSLFGGGAAEITLQFDAAGAGGSNELVRRLRIAIAADGRLVVGSTPYPLATDRPTRQHTRPSFLIDYDQPVFKRVLADARAELGASPSIADITQFVDRFITHKGMARGYDIASIVATRREGDCTEHAVLLAAVARGLKFPARVASGIAVVEIDGKPRSFGHAWTEIYRGGRWQIADAAFRKADRLVYLPLELLSDEGPGYTLSMMKTKVGTLGVRRIIVAEPEARPRGAPGR